MTRWLASSVADQINVCEWKASNKSEQLFLFFNVEKRVAWQLAGRSYVTDTLEYGNVGYVIGYVGFLLLIFCIILEIMMLLALVFSVVGALL